MITPSGSKMLRNIVLMAALLLAVAEAYPVSNAPITWHVNSGEQTPARNLDSHYLGECTCDVTRGMCDPFCCCDPDCAPDVVSMFDVCDAQQHGFADIQYCYQENRATHIKRTNNIHNIYIDRRPQAYDAICIIRTNNPSNLYRFFQVPTSTDRPQPPLSNTIVPTKSVSYQVGGTLPLARYVDIGGAPSYRSIGSVRLPLQMDDGQCSDFAREIGFLDPLQGVSCTLNGGQICSMFPTQRFANLFLFPQQFNASAPEMTPITLNLFNPDGDLIGTIDASDTSSGGAFDSTDDGTSCVNAISSISAQFTYNATGGNITIVDAVINATIGSVALITFAPMVFQVAFVDAGEFLPESIIPATPGYVAGGAMRAGTLVSTAQQRTIIEREGGFAVPSGGRTCALQNFRTVPFMHSVTSSGCTMSISESQLEGICRNGNAELILGAVNSTYAAGYPSVIDYVAITNDALTNDTASWIPIRGFDTLEFPSGSYDPYKRQCSNMVVGLSYQFVIARAGAEFNPQDVMLGAFVQPIIGSWRIGNITDFSAEATTTQNLLFRAFFSRYDPDSQATIRRRVKAPPILPWLDDSIFYPFRKPYPL